MAMADTPAARLFGGRMKFPTRQPRHAADVDATKRKVAQLAARRLRAKRMNG